MIQRAQCLQECNLPQSKSNTLDWLGIKEKKKKKEKRVHWKNKFAMNIQNLVISKNISPKFRQDYWLDITDFTGYRDYINMKLDNEQGRHRSKSTYIVLKENMIWNKWKHLEDLANLIKSEASFIECNMIKSLCLKVRAMNHVEVQDANKYSSSLQHF